MKAPVFRRHLRQVLKEKKLWLIQLENYDDRDVYGYDFHPFHGVVCPSADKNPNIKKILKPWSTT